LWKLAGVGSIPDNSTAEGEVATLPNQHACCFALGDHAAGCERGKRIAENLARGVIPYWAPWAMWEDPPNRRGSSCSDCSVGRLHPDGYIDFDHAANSNDLPFVALGPNGPTLSPWGL